MALRPIAQFQRATDLADDHLHNRQPQPGAMGVALAVETLLRLDARHGQQLTADAGGAVDGVDQEVQGLPALFRAAGALGVLRMNPQDVRSSWAASAIKRRSRSSRLSICASNWLRAAPGPGAAA